MTSDGSPKRRVIVYPTDPENKWLRIIDRNKRENEQHHDKFESDLKDLNRLKESGEEAISSMIKTLQNKLEERERELQEELDKAFEARKDQIYQNMKQLTEHKRKNEETKDSSEDLLQTSDEPEEEREKKIVSNCELVINSTPQLKYVPTQLEYKFRSLQKIEDEIGKFGKLITQPVGSGDRCIFKSTKDATNAPSAGPKTIDLDSILTLSLKTSSFDPKAKKVKLQFKFSQKSKLEGIDNIKDHLKVNVFCAEDVDDNKGEDEEPIYQETVDFSSCTPVKTKFELTINHQFKPGLNIVLKLRPKFESPDESKFKSGFGKWSREQTIEITADSESEDDDQDITFKLQLSGQQKQLTLKDDDPSLTNFGKFQAKFLGQFNQELKDDEKLALSTDDGVLDASSTLTKYASASYTINGQIIKQQEEPDDNGGGDDDAKANAPKQISTICVYADTKKRVVLKNNAKKNLYEYTMDQLKEKIKKKFKAKGLSGSFELQTASGTAITKDNEIITVLGSNDGGELRVVPK